MFERVADKINKVPHYTGTEQSHKPSEEAKEHIPFSGVSKAFHIAHAKMQKGD